MLSTMQTQSPAAPDRDGPATVSATGEARVRVAPDEADLWITLSALEPAPGDALADVTRRVSGLAEILDEFSVARRDRSIGGISVAEEFEHSQQGRRSLGYRATANASIRVTDAELIGRLITEATQRIQAQINGPHWQVSPSNPARLKAVRDASADAKRKAEALAEGLGAQLGPVLSLVETTAAPLGFRGEARRMSRSAMRASAAPDPGVPIEPGEHDIVSNVQVTFVLTES
jgi:uncharacterized protein YggE